MAPAELLFARLKRSDLHPGDIMVGKKNFPNVVNLVVESINKIPKTLIISSEGPTKPFGNVRRMWKNDE